MKKESKFFKISRFLGILLVIFGFLGNAQAANLNLFGENTDNYVQSNCYLRKEYNYFMNQWTTNEVCNPKVYEVPERTVPVKNTNQYVVDNQFLGASPYVYSAPTRGYYTGNNAYSYNTWGGYGNASNYLLGSFGGGIGSYGYYNNYYPNSVFTYTPSYGYYGYKYYDDTDVSYYSVTTNYGRDYYSGGIDTDFGETLSNSYYSDPNGGYESGVNSGGSYWGSGLEE